MHAVQFNQAQLHEIASAVSNVHSKLKQIFPGVTEVMPNGNLLLHFDSFDIVGPRIWGLYKDVCKERLDKTIAMIRAVQLGLLSRQALDHAIDNRGAGVDVEAVCKKVKERLPAFTFTGEQNPADAAPV